MAFDSIMSDTDLQVGFASFVEAAQRLESSYAELRVRAEEIDTQLARANARLESTLQEREAVFRALPVGVIAFSSTGVQRWLNPEGERIVDVAGAHGAGLVRAKPGLHELETITVFVHRVRLPDGGSLTVLEDRSRVAHLEREVDRLDRLAGLSELALGIAHEIKNPLNGVMGFSALLERQSDPDRMRQYARKIGRGMGEVDSIVKAMLAFARPEGSVAASMRPVSDILVTAAAEAEFPGDRIGVKGDVTLLADAGILTRVFANLLRNSAEAGAKFVRVELSSSDNRLTIDMGDDGPGIDAGLAPRLFEPFVSSKASGHGLGLALAARVLTFLGGAIDLLPRSAEAATAGALFRITLPRTVARTCEVSGD